LRAVKISGVEVSWRFPEAALRQMRLSGDSTTAP
jgi:hypothetical protein